MSPDRFKFAPAKLPPEGFDYRYLMATFKVSKAEAKRTVQVNKATRVYLSDTYQVNAKPVQADGWGIPLIWLSIKRIDKAAFHDWRELQSIKNAIVGPEREAMELYPAESRLVDGANQYHLWVLPEGMQFPLGFKEREVTAEPGGNAVQRPFDGAHAAAALESQARTTTMEVDIMKVVEE
jgi:hypothetical protein